MLVNELVMPAKGLLKNLNHDSRSNTHVRLRPSIGGHGRAKSLAGLSTVNTKSDNKSRQQAYHDLNFSSELKQSSEIPENHFVRLGRRHRTIKSGFNRPERPIDMQVVVMDEGAS